MTATGLAILIAVVAVAVLIARDDEPSSTRQLADVRQSCQQWIASGGPGEPGWCVGMTEWMGAQMGSGTMGGRMMWAEPGQLADSCRRWMAGDPPAGTAIPHTWCDEMAGWMSEHMPGWDGWDMGGPMMGAPDRIAGPGTVTAGATVTPG